QAVSLGNSIEVTPLTVPHRDEYSETVGYLISGPSKTALFIPDIDKWDKWGDDIRELVKKVDYAFLDATFFDGKEINHRDISEIPLPFVIESMALFKSLGQEDRSKIHFIHFNHTNPLWTLDSEATQTVLQAGFSIARKNMVFGL
ncbi:MAG: MBL fold metallo-hydrolase, partial [Flavobacteriaceae bacterium]